MILDTQVSLAEKDKCPFYNQKEWLKKYEYGEGIFYDEYDHDKYCLSSEENDSKWEQRPSEEDESFDINMTE